jgi:signal peptidase II
MPRRGAGLNAAMGSGAAADIATAAEHSHASRLWRMLLLVSAPVLALDQLTKLYVSSHFQMFQTMPIVRDWLDVTYTLNPGAAFSLFATMPPMFRGVFFIVLSAAAIIVLTVLLARRSTPLDSSVAFALILGGTAGNLIDRLARGKVIDFIYFHHESFSYPVFNIADSAITIGVAIILLASFFDSSGRSAAAPV